MTVTDLAEYHTNPAASEYVVGSINASFFYAGSPVNLVVQNNEIVNLGRYSANANNPIYYSYAFGITEDGQPLIDSYDKNVQLRFNGDSATAHDFNTGRSEGETTLFTRGYGWSVPSIDSESTEIVVKDASPTPETLIFGETVTGVVSEVNKSDEGGDSSIPEGGFVIAASGEEQGEQFADIDVGDEISYELQIDDQWMDSETMITTGPLLVEGGQVSVSMNERSSFASRREPRSAVGITADDELFMVTVDGRQSGYSDGISLTDLAEHMISLGAESAINLDGGGSTTMAATLRGHQLPSVVNAPSDGRERSMPNAIQIVSNSLPKDVSESFIELERFANLKNWNSTFARAVGDHSLSGSNSEGDDGQSAKLTYDFSSDRQEGTSAAYLEPKQPLLMEGTPKKIGMWVHGDGRENWLRLQITDRDMNTHYVDVTGENEMDWSGWNYVTAEIPSGISSPYSLSRIYIAQTDKSKKSTGTVYVNNVEAIYDAEHHDTPENEPSHNPLRGKFTDVGDDHWSVEETSYLVDQQVIKGFPGGEFKPNGQVTREQVSAMLVRQLNIDKSDREEVPFDDVSEDRYSYDSIAAATEEGLFTGRQEDQFAPEEPLTRAEAAAVLKRAYELSGESGVSFSDVDESHWAYSYIDILENNQIADGFPDGTFAPEQSVTRAEFAAFLYNASTRD
nr:S-layer homology domain-containing protein [Texcoconibacillus texcoconensis]